MQDLGAGPLWAAVLLRHRAKSTVLMTFFLKFFNIITIEYHKKWQNVGVDLYVRYMIKQPFLLWGVGIPHVPPFGVTFMTNCILLWWSLDSVLLPLVLKPKVVKEALQWSGERNCKVTSTKLNWQANWNYNAITSLMLNNTFVWRRTDLEKLLKHELIAYLAFGNHNPRRVLA